MTIGDLVPGMEDEGDLFVRLPDGAGVHRLVGWHEIEGDCRVVLYMPTQWDRRGHIGEDEAICEMAYAPDLGMNLPVRSERGWNLPLTTEVFRSRSDAETVK